jgi:hypothetical protein
MGGRKARALSLILSPSGTAPHPSPPHRKRGEGAGGAYLHANHRCGTYSPPATFCPRIGVPANASPHRLRGAGFRPIPKVHFMSILISLLITVLVIGLVLYLVRMLPLDSQIKNVVQIIVIVIGIISLLRYLAVF